LIADNSKITRRGPEKMCRLFLWSSIILLNNCFAQSNVNPDISLIGFFNTFTNNVKDSESYGKLNFETPGFEMLIEGYLNPYARAVATLAYEEEEFSVEELYAEVLRGLPFDLQIKAGKYLLGFGKLNTGHPHTWPFLTRPLVQQIYLGPEGFNDTGFELSFILPFEEIYSSVSVGLYKGDAIANSLVNDGNVQFGDRGVSPITVGRWGAFIALSDYTSLEIGLSGSYGIYARQMVNSNGDSLAEGPMHSFPYLYAGLDFKYKYVPDLYSALTIQGEGLINHRDVLRDSDGSVTNPKETVQQITTFGGFVYGDFRFKKQFSVGVKYDFTYGIIGDKPGFYTLGNDDKNHTMGLYTWFDYYPVEETLALRLQWEHLMFDYADVTTRDPESTITLQLLFSLGPHKAHPF